MTHTYELPAVYDSRKSFYGKAMVEVNDRYEKTLLSYGTRILTIDADGKLVKRHWYGSSHTTTRHIKEFCRQNNADYETYLNA